jgi:microsomal dipeptidase-like Zn-dependent dipeptidase
VSGYSRRQFVRTAALGAAGVLASGPFGAVLARGARAVGGRTPPGVFADLHYHASLRATVRESPVAVAAPTLNRFAQLTFNRTGGSWEEAHGAGIDLVCAVHYDPFDEIIGMAVDPSLDAPAHTHRMLDLLETELNGRDAAHARLARTPAALRQALADRREGRDDRVIVLHALEGAHALGGALDPLDGLAARGVAYITLAHFFDKGVASVGNCLPFIADAGRDWPSRGLSDFGRRLIARMEALGVLVDATHASSTAMEDIFKTAQRPFFVSHTSVRTLSDHPYSLPDEHLLEIKRRGGLIGIVLFPYTLSNYDTYEVAQQRGSLTDVVRSVRYLVKLLGDHRQIAIGSDFSGFIVGPRDMTRLGQVGRLRRALMAELGDQAMVTDIMAGNATRFLATSWGRG